MERTTFVVLLFVATIAIGTATSIFLSTDDVLPMAFADSDTQRVIIPVKSGNPGCETTNECYIPHTVRIDVGDSVIWFNDDVFAHTVTSGYPDTGRNGIFDSSLFMANNEFEVMFNEIGTFPYFCYIHPWMIGEVIVGRGDKEPPQNNPPPPPTPAPNPSPSPPPPSDIDKQRLAALEEENRQLIGEIERLEEEISELEEKIEELEELIIKMTSEFLDAISQLNQWFRDNLS